MIGLNDFTSFLTSVLVFSVSESLESDSAASEAFSWIDDFNGLGVLLGVGGGSLGFVARTPVVEVTESSSVPGVFGVAAIAWGFEKACGGLVDEARTELLGEACTCVVDLLVGLACGLGIELIGPTITLAGTFFGAGLGMYGCLRPPDSETTGILLGGDEGLSMPFDSPKYLGLSSQLDAIGEAAGSDADGLLNGLSTPVEDGVTVLSSGFDAIIVGGLEDVIVGEAIGTGMGCFNSILGGAKLGSRPKLASVSFADDDLTVIEGTASRGVLKAFSQDPGRGSVAARLG